MTVKIRYGFFLLMSVFLITFPTIAAEAKEGTDTAGTEVVVVLDCSKSMEDVDDQYLAFDLAKSLPAILPGDYHVGMVAFNQEICVKVPIGGGCLEMESALEGKTYTNYGNAGAALAEAVAMFSDGEADRRILLISDGEIMMKTEEDTLRSVELYEQAVREAGDRGIAIDVAALGGRIEEGYTVYSAPDATGGRLYELADGEELGRFTQRLLFEEWGLHASHVGKLDGTDGELTVRLPDCLMRSARVILLGDQQNDNVAVSCDAARMNVLKGKKYTVIELQEPGSGEIRIQMRSDIPMDVNAYLTAEYEYTLGVDSDYDQETGTVTLSVEILNHEGQNLLEGALKDCAVDVYLGSEKQAYCLEDGRICISKACSGTFSETLKIDFGEAYGNYYGTPEEPVTVEAAAPAPEEEQRETDWFFRLTIIGFGISLSVVLLISCLRNKNDYKRHKVVKETRMLPEERQGRGNEWGGKLQVYVIHNREGIDYPPESINLFARCGRDMITLEWILDTCNLPLMLSGAEKIILRPGDDRSLLIKNSSRASVLMGRELLAKGRPYHLYYGEKVTFIFDREEAEIEVHYRDLRPNERQGR